MCGVGGEDAGRLGPGGEIPQPGRQPLGKVLEVHLRPTLGVRLAAQERLGERERLVVGDRLVVGPQHGLPLRLRAALNTALVRGQAVLVATHLHHELDQDATRRYVLDDGALREI